MADESTRLINTASVFNTLNNGHNHQNNFPQHTSVHTKRLLNSRHISMISIGGIIGTGLFIGIRQTLTNGPIISIISYMYISMLCYYIITAVGEMSCFMPLNGSLCQFQFKFISNPVGIMNNFVYWISWSVTLGLELSLIYELLCQLIISMDLMPLLLMSSMAASWLGDKSSVLAVTWLALTSANLFPVNYYGEVEFMVTIIKVGFMVTWIGLSIWLVFTGVGFTNWLNFELIWGINTIEVVNSPVLNKLVNILSSSIVSSCFTFQSIESVGICSGEIENIGQNLPKAIKYIVMRILVFYIGSLILLTLMIPSNDPQLVSNNNNDSSSNMLMSSPFVVGLINCGIGNGSYLIQIVNFVILTSMISAANSNIYFGSRCLISMIEEGYFWRVFGKTIMNSGVPVYAILLTSFIGLVIALLSNFKSAGIFLTLLINLSATSGLLMWLFILISYLRFRKALEYNNINHGDLVYTSLFCCFPMKQSSWISIVSIVGIILSNGIVNIWQFSWDSFASCYLTLIVVVVGVLYFSFKWDEPVLRSVDEIDIFTNQSSNAF